MDDESKDENQLLELLVLSSDKGGKTSKSLCSYFLLLEYFLLS